MRKAFEKLSVSSRSSTHSGSQEHESSHHDNHQQHERHGPIAKRRMVWPPKIHGIDELGEVRDTNGRKIPRDLGRSIQFGGHIYYMFADTFCFDDKEHFVGLQNNTHAIVNDPSKPLQSTYQDKRPLVPHFIPYTKEEEQYNERDENKQKSSRIVNWAFGGIIEDEPGCGTGWLLSDVAAVKGAGGMGMTPVRVTTHNGNHLKAERVSGPIKGTAQGEPRFGNGNIHVDHEGGWAYLLGGFKLLNLLARIKLPLQKADDWHDQSRWEYWVKSPKGPHWAPSYSKWQDLKPVLGACGQGAIMHMPKLGPKGKPWINISVGKFPDSKMRIAAAEKIEGPWDVHEMGELPKCLGEKSRIRYCLYPHIWADGEAGFSQGRLVISWSDNGIMGGRVFLGRLKFETVEDDDKDEL